MKISSRRFLMYNFIYDYINDYMGFFSRVEENGVSINKKSIEDIDLLQSEKNEIDYNV